MPLEIYGRVCILQFEFSYTPSMQISTAHRLTGISVTDYCAYIFKIYDYANYCINEISDLACHLSIF